MNDQLLQERIGRAADPVFFKASYEAARGMGYDYDRAADLAEQAQREAHRYAGFDPQQPRDEEGQWIEAGGYHVQVDKEGIIRKGGHVGLHGKHHTEAEGFVPPAAAPALPAQQPAPSPEPQGPADQGKLKPHLDALKVIKDNRLAPDAFPKLNAAMDEIGKLPGTDVAALWEAMVPGGPKGTKARTLERIKNQVSGVIASAQQSNFSLGAPAMPSPDELAKSLGQPQQSGGPLAGMSNEQALAEIMKRTKVPVGGVMAQGAEGNPLGYDLTPGDSPVAQQVLQAAIAQQQSNPFARLTIPQMYAQFGKGMTPFQFQNELVKAHKAGKLHLGAFTQALAGIPDVKQAIPLDREVRWYVEPPRSGVAKHAEPEQPDRYLDGRTMRQHHGKSVEHAVARLQALADREDDADEEEIEGTVNGIARQFSAAQLKEVALALGIRGSTKGILIQRIIDQLIEKGD